MPMIEHIKTELRTLRGKLHLILLALFPFTDQILGLVNENLPSIAPYVPANVYKWVGLGLVLFNVGVAVAKMRKVSNG